MEISAAVVEYFQKISYKKWNLAECLRHVANNCSNVTLQCKEEIANEIKRQLYFTKDHESISQFAKNKATKFIRNVDRVFESEEIATIFQEYDTKVIENAKKGLLSAKTSLYASEVEISVIDDKRSTITLPHKAGVAHLQKQVQTAISKKSDDDNRLGDEGQQNDEDENGNQVSGRPESDAIVNIVRVPCIERLESTEVPGRKRPYILTSGTDVASVLKSYAKNLPDGQKCDDFAYWGILDLTGDSIESKALFTEEDWAEMVQSFRQEVKLSETPISDNVSRLFDKIDETIRSGLSNPRDIEHALKDINDVDSYPIKRAILTYADNLEGADLPMSEAVFDNLFPNMLARKLLDQKQLKVEVGEICCWASAQRRNQGRSVVLRAQIGQRCDFKGTLRSSIDKVEAIVGLRSGGLPEAHRKKIFTDRIDLAVTMRDILYAFFSANPNAPDDKLHQMFVLGVQSWGWMYDVYAMDCKGINVCRLGRLNRTKMPNAIETIACLEEICTIMADIKATLGVICNKANDAALSNARVRRRKRTDDNDDAVEGCFGKVSGTPAKKRSTKEL